MVKNSYYKSPIKFFILSKKLKIFKVKSMGCYITFIIGFIAMIAVGIVSIISTQSFAKLFLSY